MTIVLSRFCAWQRVRLLHSSYSHANFTIFQGSLETIALVITTRIGVGETSFSEAKALVLSTKYQASTVVSNHTFVACQTVWYLQFVNKLCLHILYDNCLLDPPPICLTITFDSYCHTSTTLSPETYDLASLFSWACVMILNSSTGYNLQPFVVKVQLRKHLDSDHRYS